MNFVETTETEDGNTLIPILLKAFGIVLLFILSIVMGLLPLKLKRFQTDMRLTGVVNALSAGIFLSVSLLHLLPEATENFEENLNTKFPLAFLIAILSYTFILIIEKLAFDTHKWLEVHVHPDVHHHQHKKTFKQNKQEASTFLVSVKENYDCCDEDKGEMKNIEKKNVDECNRIMECCSHDEALMLLNKDSQRKFSKNSEILDRNQETPLNHYHNKSMDDHKDMQFSLPNEKIVALEEPLIIQKAQSSAVSETQKREEKINQLKEHKHFGQNLDFDEYHFKDLVNSKANVARTITYHDKHRKKHEKKRKRIEEEKKLANNVSSPLSPEEKPPTREIGKMTPYILLIALSFHGIFEGIAIGLQQELTSLANLLIAVALHKWAEALTLGMSFNKNESRKNLSVRMITIFSSTGSLGIAIGWGLAQTSVVVAAIFMSISAGTFLYISASEVVVEEFSISRNKWMKLVFFLIGVALITGLWFLEEAES